MQKHKFALLRNDPKYQFLKTHYVLFFILILFSHLFLAKPLKADDISNNFYLHLNQEAVDELTKDLGILVGGGSFHTGKSLGFPFGYDVGIHAVSVRAKNNPILADDRSISLSKSIQAELGLPKKMNLIIRKGIFENADFYGMGLRYGLIKNETSGQPSIAISGIYNEIFHDLFKAEVVSINIATSFSIRYIHPYFGIGYDLSRLDIRDHVLANAPLTTPSNLYGKQDKLRAEAGLNISFVPFTYITLGAGIAHNTQMYHAAFGIQF